MGEASGSSKVAKGSAIIFIGNIIFRVGGYVYRFLMASLLGPAAYGIFGLTTPFQGIFQVLSAAGLPPAIAKYVSEYNVLDEEDLARQTVFTALKIMVFLGFFFGLVMVFVAAPIITNYYHKPEALLPLQAVGLITPFSVIVGAFRGAFQGVYKMEYILYTRAIEQIFMILFATALVILGLSTFGAVLGSALGFAASAASAVYIFKRYMGKYIPPANPDFKFTLDQELNLAKRLIFFSIPITITALAEMGIYSICTLIMGGFLAASAIGYFIAADPISRLPLIVSSSLATTILPASSEAYALKDQLLLEKYVNASYKYGMFFVIPMCVGIAIFAKEIMGLVYFTNAAYMNGAMSLAILVIGMTFYSIYTISGSIVQGIGNPRIPMYLLIFGCIITLGLGWYLIPKYGIEGGALATTIASFLMMIPMFLLQFRLTKTHAPYAFLTKVTIASLIMTIPSFFLPNNSIGLIIGLIICPIVYMIAIVALRTLSHDDVVGFRRFTTKLGPIRKYVNKLLDIIDRYSS
ncbi:flippase [Methanobrevibacter olleyae]|uniref:Polysaccharide biosynthesis protein n=1 Tax=Methanobrevibacter olleyae TaxID=294671 RepID=A0A126R2G7_METOL|nr:flippase [Methanobrevibacter olleyae]AMK16234.1 polysaccharide biosynthesis protein [Methanobrevibacter olleyae]SFL60971.1 stage V sporulation protein B [Methanobrevibacter olleyae]